MSRKRRTRNADRNPNNTPEYENAHGYGPNQREWWEKHGAEERAKRAEYDRIVLAAQQPPEEKA